MTTATTIRPTDTTRRALTVLLVAALLLTGLLVPGAALAAPGDGLAPQPNPFDEIDVPVNPTTKATISASPSCDHDLGPGFSYAATLVNPPKGVKIAPKITWRPEGGPTAGAPAPNGYVPSGEGTFEVQVVYVVTQVKLPPVPVATHVSDWVPVTVSCDDGGGGNEDGGDDNDGGDDGDGAPSGGVDVLDDVIVGTPNFTG